MWSLTRLYKEHMESTSSNEANPKGNNVASRNSSCFWSSTSDIKSFSLLLIRHFYSWTAAIDNTAKAIGHMMTYIRVYNSFPSSKSTYTNNIHPHIHVSDPIVKERIRGWKWGDPLNSKYNAKPPKNPMISNDMLLYFPFGSNTSKPAIAQVSAYFRYFANVFYDSDQHSLVIGHSSLKNVI